MYTQRFESIINSNKQESFRKNKISTQILTFNLAYYHFRQWISYGIFVKLVLKIL